MSKEIKKIGLKVFDTKEQFELWMNTSSKALRNKKPIDIIKTKKGKQILLDELHNIEHGIFL